MVPIVKNQNGIPELRKLYLKMDPSDWRLQGQEKYLKGQTLHFKKYSDRTSGTDHDHCEFCSATFADNIDDALHEGFSTMDDYRWICVTCFTDFAELFNFTHKNSFQ
jgi:hypothetical protein